MQSSIHSRGLFALSVYRERKKGRKKGKEGEKERGEKEKRLNGDLVAHRLRRRAYGARSVLGADTPGPHFFSFPANMCPTPAVPLPAHFPPRFLRPARSVSTTSRDLRRASIQAFLADFLSLRRVRTPRHRAARIATSSPPSPIVKLENLSSLRSRFKARKAYSTIAKRGP